MVRSKLGTPIHQAFEQQVRRSPGAVALAGAEGQMTYAQLAARADAIAAALLERNVRPGDIVSTLIPRSFDAIAAMLAVLRAGAAYCPIDPALPSARLQWMLADARPAVLLCTARTDLASPIALRVDSIAHQTRNPVSVEVDPGDPACVMYTSGSTGTPKAALIPHRGIDRLILQSDFVPFGPQLRTLSHSAMHFDASTFEIWAPLLHGGTCVLFAGGPVPTLHELKASIQTQQVNCAFFGPAPFNIIIDEDPDVIRGVTHVLIGGEALSVPHTRKAMRLFPGTQFINGYGPTETTTFAVTCQISPDLPAEARSVPIGRPIAQTQCYLLNEAGELVADGEVGELFIGGAGVAIGYLNRPELTAERFVVDRFGPDPCAKLYKTGDLCRRLSDGQIEYVGRNDQQVKIHGQRIELGEIEATLAEHAGVSQAVVLMREADGDKHLAAYYTQLKTVSCDESLLRQHLRSRLPAYMVPRWIVRLDTIPITVNGKVDRQALPAPLAETITTSEQPLTATQSTLLQLWRQALQNDRVSIDDSFFALGGTSLGAMRLCSLIERATGAFVPIAVIETCPSAARMAAYIQSRPDGERLNGGAHASCVADRTPLFCVPGVNGSTFGMASLVARMNSDRPAFCFESKGLDGSMSPAETVEEAAEYFIERIRQAGAPNSLALLGYSFGGVVVWEMAQRLSRQGCTVRALILLDAYAPAAVRRKGPVARLGIHANYLLHRGPMLMMNTVRWHLKHARRRRAARLLTAPLDLAAARVQTSNQTAFHNYRPMPYDGDVVYLRCAEQPLSMRFYHDPHDGGWKSLATGRLHCYLIDGTHDTLFSDPYCSTIFDRINQYLGEHD